jgi:hypothetical protein
LTQPRRERRKARPSGRRLCPTPPATSWIRSSRSSQPDAARKAASYASFFTAFALLIGAFIASAAGALGGRRRDEF